jgi:chemotaxis protein MotB
MPIAGSPKREGSSGSSWLTTFGDMVTLLFTFFVLVYSFCSYSPGEWETAVGSIKGALAVVPGMKGNKVVPGGGSGSFSGHMGVVPLFGEVPLLEEARHRAFGEELLKIREQMAGTEGIEIEATESGVMFRIANPILFDKGSADVKSSAMQLLEAISRATHTTSATVIVTGHTCDLPICTPVFRSNWELSARRATNVIRAIIAAASPQTRFVTLARGQYAPLVPNEDEACRIRNRRVEIEFDLEGGLQFGS